KSTTFWDFFARTFSAFSRPDLSPAAARERWIFFFLILATFRPPGRFQSMRRACKSLSIERNTAFIEAVKVPALDRQAPPPCSKNRHNMIKVINMIKF
ncbi:MAG: hypothetical protein ORN28_04095, partial [Rhodoferax sp.]|nr:hypothetical protein [Rhodoferax sp.]